MCRFINADDLTCTGQGYVGHNMFAYCNNSPVISIDESGAVVDTIFDVISIGFSIAEVIANPSDPWAWVGLAGDLVDLVPCVTGVGELVRGIKAVSATAGVVDNVVDGAKVAKKASGALSDAGKSINNARKSAVRKAWQNEAAMARTGGSLSREWTPDELAELISTGKVKGYHGHHMKSVQGYPDLAGDPLNIQFLTPSEHLAAHGGSWKNITHGRYIV